MPTAAGRRISGRGARRIGTGSSSTRQRFRYCWQPRLPTSTRSTASTSARWCSGRCPGSQATAHRPGKTAGKRMPASMPSRLPFASLRWSAARDICPSPREASLWQSRISGTAASRCGPRPATQRSPGTAALPRTTFVVCRRWSPPAPRASDTCCRSRITASTRAWPRTSRSARTSCSWCGWGCGKRTTRWSSTVSGSSIDSSRCKRRSDHHGIGTTATATASTWMVLRSTVSESAVLGRCLPESAAIWRSPRGAIRSPTSMRWLR